jgi:hypothetical protein
MIKASQKNTQRVCQSVIFRLDEFEIDTKKKEILIRLGRRFLGNLLPTGPLALATAKISQVDVITSDATDDLFIAFDLPVHKKVAFTLAFRTCYLTLYPS